MPITLFWVDNKLTTGRRVTTLDRIRKQKQDTDTTRYLKEKVLEFLRKGARVPFHRDPVTCEGLLKVTW